MNDPLETLLELRAYLDQHAATEYIIGNGPVPNKAAELLVKLDELVEMLKTDFGLEERPDPYFDRDKIALRKESKARDSMDDKD